jgi:dihydrolipoamide dehydrogenase
LQVTHEGDVREIEFKHAVIAAGSMPVTLPGAPDDPRIIDSTGALALEDIPGKLLVIGGGIIGLEMASVYAALGTKVTVVELFDALMPGCDPDLVEPLAKRLEARFQGIYLSTKVANVKAQKRRIKVEFEGEGAPASAMFDKVLVAIGRRPNGGTLGLEHAGVTVDDRGFISVDSQQRTNVPHIFAIGDICGQPMLAHKATHEAKVAAEVIAGQKVHFEPLGIPSVAYTDPEVAWVGLTEEQAKKDKTEVDKAVFPWAASGRAIGMDRAEGFTKLLFDKDTGRLIGAGIVGRHAGDLISEAVLALELGADAHDIGLTVHPHPTLSETINFTAEMVTGSITDLFVPRRKGQDK